MYIVQCDILIWWNGLKERRTKWFRGSEQYFMLMFKTFYKNLNQMYFNVVYSWSDNNQCGVRKKSEIMKTIPIENIKNFMLCFCEYGNQIIRQ